MCNDAPMVLEVASSLDLLVRCGEVPVAALLVVAAVLSGMVVPLPEVCSTTFYIFSLIMIYRILYDQIG
jgi:hypothetical protein